MKLLFLAALVAVSMPASAVYKCQAANGKVSFQEVPCGDTESQSAIKTFAAPEPAAGARSSEERIAINGGILHSYPVRGMTLQELHTAMGTPTRTNTGDYEGGYTEQRVYQRPGGNYYVYTEGGIVRAVQNSPGGGQRGAAQPQQQQAQSCPSETDIRNAEVSANSISLSPAERNDRRRKIDQMRACRAG